MTTACVIAAAVILVAGLFAVIVERTNERDTFAREIDTLAAELAAAEDKVTDLETAFAEVRQALSDGRVVQPLRPTNVVPLAPRNTDDALWSALYGEKGDRRG